MRGRPRTPTAIKILRGNPGQHPLPENEPQPELGATAPAFIVADPELKAEWDRHAERLTRYGVLTVTDDDALACLCVASVRFRTLVANGAPDARLWESLRELRQLWGRFGMTPADRSRVKVTKPGPVSKLGQFRGGERKAG